MPRLTQNSYLCQICFQRFFCLTEARKHYNSSHGDEREIPWNSESESEEESSFSPGKEEGSDDEEKYKEGCRENKREGRVDIKYRDE